MLSINHKALIVGFATMATISACNNSSGTMASDNSSPGTTTADTSGNPPVETKDANTDYKPAFPGQTRAPGVKTKTALNITVINSDLDHPWGLRSLPDGRFLVTQKSGTMLILSADGKQKRRLPGYLLFWMMARVDYST